MAPPGCKNCPTATKNTVNCTTPWCNFHRDTSRPLPKERRCHPRQQDSPPLPTTPPDTPCAYACVGAVCIVLAPPRTPPKKTTPIFCIVAHAIPNCGAATSHRTRTYCFNGDIGHIIIDVSLVRRRVSMCRRSCRPQRVDFRRNSSTRCHNELASTASPNDLITTLLACRHLLRNGQYPQRAHCRGGGLCSPTREVTNIIIIIIYFIIYLYSMLTPYPPPSLLLLTSTTGRLMIASRARRRF